MATTITTSPDSISGARRPIKFVCTNDVYDTATNAEAVSAVANNGSGKCRYSITSHNYQIGDVLTGSGFATATTYNVRQTVSARSATYVDTDVTFTQNDTGTLTRSNDNFQVKGAITINGTLTATLYAKPDSSGNFTFYFHKILKSTISRNSASFSATGLTTANTGLIKTYSVAFTGQFDGADGLLKDDPDGSTSSSTLYAIDYAYKYLEDQDTDDYILVTGQTSKFLTNAPLTGIDLRTDEAFHLSFLTNQASIRYAYQTWTNGAWSSTTLSGSTSMASSKFGTLSIYNLFGSSDKIKVWIAEDNASPSYTSQEVIFIKQTKPTAERFYFRNSRGAYELISFTGQLIKSRVTAKESFEQGLSSSYSIGDRGDVVTDVKEWEERTATMDYKSDGVTQWVSEIIASEDVYIMSGTNLIPVLVLTDKQTYYDNLLLNKIQLTYRIINL